MVANSATTKSDAPLSVFDKFSEEWVRQCRLCGNPLELDEKKGCYRHRQGKLLNSLSPSKFPHCDGEQMLYPKESKEISNKKSQKKRMTKKDKRIAKLNSMRAKTGQKLIEKVDGRYKKTSHRTKKLGK